MEGKRPLVAEVQALIAPTSSPQPRRVTSGLDSSRTAMMLGILERRANLKLSTADCFVATVGGMRLLEPATDLATALAIVSSVKDIPLPSGLVAIGEIGLAGDIRRVTALEKRLGEAARLGFTDAIVPSGTKVKLTDITTHEVSNIAEAIATLGKIEHQSADQPDF
jgi:DNA repair protein RadA/Sms